MTEPKFKISISAASRMRQWLVGRTNILLANLGLRKRPKFWGIVYDAVTKQPLDPVLLTLAYVGETETQNSITDMNGNYGFLAHPGKFKILAKKTNYSFPSVIVKGNVDGIYDNLYHGEFFTMVGGREVIAPNIPMDPQNFDWNQQAKLGMTKRYAMGEYAFKALIKFIFWAILALLAASAWVIGLRPWEGSLPPLQRYQALYLGVGLYAALLFLAATTPKVRLWGQVKYQGARELKLWLELTRPGVEGIIFGQSQVGSDGIFFLRAMPGKYKITIKEEVGRAGQLETLGEVSVNVGPEKIVNQTIKLIDEN